MYVGFDAIKNAGKTTTIVEQLKNKSVLVSKLPVGEVYKSFNVWVGNSGYATSKNIENPIIGFKVEKSWLKDKFVDQDSITLNRYSDKKWTQLPANLTGEDNRYLYFTAETPGFASFAITGKAISQVQDENAQISAENRSIGVINSEGNGTEGSEPDEGNMNSNTLLSFGIVLVALVMVGMVLKTMKK
jgi:PGF-pre-PGF domain-containing protein